MSTSFSARTDAVFGRGAVLTYIFRLASSSVVLGASVPLYISSSWWLRLYERKSYLRFAFVVHFWVFLSEYKLYNYMTRQRWRWRRRLHSKYEAWAYLLPLIYSYYSFFVRTLVRSSIRFRHYNTKQIYFHYFALCFCFFFSYLFCLCRVIVSLSTHPYDFLRASVTLSHFHQFHSVISECAHFISCVSRNSFFFFYFLFPLA